MSSSQGPRDGSEEFWQQKLVGVLDEDDISEVASKLTAAKFKQKHVGKLSRDDLLLAKLAPATIKDFMENQHLLGGKDTASNVGGGEQKRQETAARGGRLFATLVRIPEEELSLEEVVGRGSFSVVRRATWSRAIAVGNQRVHTIKVAVKLPKLAEGDASDGLLSEDLARELAVISGLPHQNILTLHGVCESAKGSHKVVFELMTTDLSKLLKETMGKSSASSASSSSASAASSSASSSKQGVLLPTQVLLRVLRDVSAGLAHLHSNGVVHRDVKPANVLLRDEQVKLCDFGSSRDLQHTLQQMTVTGTLDYMAPEVLKREPAGRAADVWGFGVLLFECVTGGTCARATPTAELSAELARAGCLPALIQLFAECHHADPNKRPVMAAIHSRLQQLVMQDASDSQRLKEELKRAEAQDRDTYESTWSEHYAKLPHARELLEYTLKLQQTHSQAVRQPLEQLQGKGSLAELEQLATSRVRGRLHAQLKSLVEECGGSYVNAPAKSYDRCVQKVEQEYDGDYSKLLDMERATGLFEQPADMLRCLQRVQAAEQKQEQEQEQKQPSSFASASASPASTPAQQQQLQLQQLRVLRCKDRLNKPLECGYRDVLLNVCDVQSGFVAELQLNFHKIAQIKSQTHRFYELVRVMEIKWTPHAKQAAPAVSVPSSAPAVSVLSPAPAVSVKLKRMGQRLRTLQLAEAVKCPPNEDKNEWLAVNTVDFYNEINMLYGSIAEYCTKEGCPAMTAGQHAYLWADGVKIKKPVSVSAPEYIDLLMQWVELQLNDETIFPVDYETAFPKDFISIVKTIFKRYFRVYAHIYHHHFKKVVDRGEEAKLNRAFSHLIHFITEFDLVDATEMEPLKDLVGRVRGIQK